MKLIVLADNQKHVDNELSNQIAEMLFEFYVRIIIFNVCLLREYRLRPARTGEFITGNIQFLRNIC